MRTRTDPSDLTDWQWRLVRHPIPVHPGGRPRKTNTRDVLDAVSYLLKTVCHWRFLPADSLPRSTVSWYFDE